MPVVFFLFIATITNRRRQIQVSANTVPKKQYDILSDCGRMAIVATSILKRLGKLRIEKRDFFKL